MNGPTHSTASTKTARTIAFEKSGLSHDQVARMIDVSPAYVKVLLRNGAKSYCTAERLRKVLGCRIEIFIPNQTAPDRNKPQKEKEMSKGQTVACKSKT